MLFFPDEIQDSDAIKLFYKFLCYFHKILYASDKFLF